MTAQDETLARGDVATWAGAVQVAASESGIREIFIPRWQAGRARGTFEPRINITHSAGAAANEQLELALTELGEYFAGQRRDFTVALDPIGPEFFQRVWDEVARVPYGETRSYGEIAAAVGAAQASRAVGAANGANPLAPIVPCHRIVGSDGKLTGYGPGLPLKHILLAMEDAVPADADDYDAWAARLAGRRPGLLLGNRRTRHYCGPTCVHARAAATQPARFFASAGEAEAAGYAACPVCQGGRQERLLAAV